MATILYKTRLGIILRAAVNDSEMVNALGFNVPLVFTGVFAFGAALGLGHLAGPLLTTYPGMAHEILIDAFVVIVVGGFGSLGGAVVALAAFLFGELQSFGVLLFPKLSLALANMSWSVRIIFRGSSVKSNDRHKKHYLPGYRCHF